MAEIPILEFDPDPRGIIEPSERFQAGRLPERVLISFFDREMDKLAERENAVEVLRLESVGRDQAVLKMQWDGREIALFKSGVGSALAGGFLEELIALGGRKFMVCGGAGVLDSAITQGHLILPTAALREEGLSYHYLPAGRDARPGQAAVAALEGVLAQRKAPYVEGRTWSTDGLYRETRGKIARRKEQGCLCVEMEAAGFFAVAEFRKVQLAQLLYGGDDVGGAEWDHRGWGSNFSVQAMMQEICLEALLGF